MKTQNRTPFSLIIHYLETKSPLLGITLLSTYYYGNTLEDTSTILGVSTTTVSRFISQVAQDLKGEWSRYKSNVTTIPKFYYSSENVKYNIVQESKKEE